MFTKAIKNLILTNASFASRLASFDFGDGVNRPAIFTGERPDDAFLPCITMDETAISDFGCKGYRGGVIQVELSLWGDRTMATSDLGEMANDLWRTIHWRNVTVQGYRTTAIIANPPERIGDQNDFTGYYVPAEITYMEEATT